MVVVYHDCYEIHIAPSYFRYNDVNWDPSFLIGKVDSFFYLENGFENGYNMHYIRVINEIIS